MWSEFNSEAGEDKYRLFDVFARKPKGDGIVVTNMPGSTSLTQPSQSTEY